MEKSTENNKTAKERDMGIELLRVLSMLMVVILHMLGKGGILAHAALTDTMPPAEGGSAAGYAAAYLLETMCLCAVNCYALISGYVGAGRRFRYARLFEIHAQVLFYTILITAAFCICKPELLGLTLLRNAFFPVMTQQYWYYTGYFGLMLLMPALDILSANMPRRAYRGLIAAIVLLLSVLPAVFVSDVFYIHQGYSLWWLAALYLIGAYIKKYGCYLFGRRWISLLIYVGCALLAFGANMLERNTELSVPELSYYASPVILLSAVALLSVFAGMQVSSALKKLLGVLAPCAFGVYLLHAHPLIWEHLIRDRFADLAARPVLLIPAVIGIAAAVYVVCALVDFARARLFSVCKIHALCQRLGGAADGMFGGDAP